MDAASLPFQVQTVYAQMLRPSQTSLSLWKQGHRHCGLTIHGPKPRVQPQRTRLYHEADGERNDLHGEVSSYVVH